MFIEEEWSIGNLIRKLRKEQGLTLAQLSYGLCSTTTMNRIETEGKVENLLLTNSILHRLGVNPDKFELYSGKAEFEQLECRIRIQNDIRDGQFEHAEKELEEYQALWRDSISSDRLQEQFVKTILGHLAVWKKDLETGILLFHQAIQITLPDWNQMNIREYALSENELNLLISLADANELFGERDLARSMRMQIYDYINQGRKRKDINPKLFTEVVCKTMPHLIEEGNARLALEMCNQGLKVLSDTKRMFNWPDLLRLKGECLEALYEKESSKRDEIVQAYEKAYYIYDLFGDYEKADKVKVYLEERYQWESI